MKTNPELPSQAELLEELRKSTMQLLIANRILWILAGREAGVITVSNDDFAGMPEGWVLKMDATPDEEGILIKASLKV